MLASPFSVQSSAIALHADAAGAPAPRRDSRSEVVLRQDWFHCEDCGSPGVSVPRRLDDTGVVSCASCGLSLGSWTEYRRRIGRALLAEQAGKAHPVVVADPIGSVGAAG